MKIFIRHLARIFYRLLLSVSKQLFVIGTDEASRDFIVTFDTIFAYQLSLDTFN